ETAAGMENSEHFAKHLWLVDTEIEDPVGDHEVDGAIGQGQGINFPSPKFDVCDANQRSIAFRLFEHRLGAIDADHPARGPDAAGRQDTIEARPGAEIYDNLARMNFAQAKGVTYAGEGLRNADWQVVNIASVVSEPLGTRGADWEFMLFLR